MLITELESELYEYSREELAKSQERVAERRRYWRELTERDMEATHLSKLQAADLEHQMRLHDIRRRGGGQGLSVADGEDSTEVGTGASVASASEWPSTELPAHGGSQVLQSADSSVFLESARR